MSHAILQRGADMRGLGLVGLVAAAAAGGAGLWLAAGPPAAGPPSAEAPLAEALPAARPAPPEPAPRFDVARVGARGMLVAAGRAAPGAEVTLLESGRDLGHARADGHGEWVILPGDPLPPACGSCRCWRASPGRRRCRPPRPCCCWCRSRRRAPRIPGARRRPGPRPWPCCCPRPRRRPPRARCRARRCRSPAAAGSGSTW
ncbi:hypothetical protein ACFQY5_08905 [Paeniroseomonas aquatica]